MFVRLCQVSALFSAVILAALPATASTISSSNGADVIGYSSGSSFSGLGWMSQLNSGTEADDDGFFSPATSFVTGSATFGVSGATLAGAYLAGNSFTPMVITPPDGDTALTAVALELTGNINITLTLSDGSTVTATNTGSSPAWVSFLSPLQITAIQLDSTGGFTVQDFSSGTANPADLPAQPGDSGGSPTSEGPSMWLAGGGLLVLSQFLRRRCHTG
jgi:hypothetical protein